VLEFGKEFVDIDLGNNRENVSLVVCSIQNAINSYTDLDFLIPESITSANSIPKAFVYVDNVNIGADIEDHLSECLPAHLAQECVIQCCVLIRIPDKCHGSI
jgi:hypothetical protein